MELVLDAPMRLPRPHRPFTCTALACFMATLSACSGAGGEHPAPAGHEEEQARLLEPATQLSGEAGAGPGTCPPGVVRECKVLLSQQGSVKNCFVGVQLCTDEAWGPCQSVDQL